MIEIHWLWIPFIVSFFLCLLAYILEKGEEGALTIIAGVITFISIVIYVVAFVSWVLNHVRIVS